jgi:drug/metabolite transporter (DMT)-like permease
MNRKSNTSSMQGIIWHVVGMLLFGSMDAVSKYLTTLLPVPEILWVRYLFFAFFGFVLAIYLGGFQALRTKILIIQILRGLALVSEIILFTYSFRYLPLADAHVMAATVPLMVLALAVPILGEKVGFRRWLAVIIGFLGILIILRPGFEEWNPILILPLLGAVGFAVYLVLTRMAARHDSVGTSAFYTGIVGFIVLSFMVPTHWEAPTVQEWGWLIVASILGLVAHISIMKGLTLSEASALQPFNYIVLVWATFLGFVVFGDIPDLITCSGAGVIVASGLYAWNRERIQSNKLVSEKVL